MSSNLEGLRSLPGVDRLLNLDEIKLLEKKYNKEYILFIINNVLNDYRRIAKNKGSIPAIPAIVEKIYSEVQKFTSKSLRNVVNATGIVLHTNLGRAPFSKDTFEEVGEILTGYNNLEFDLDKAKRGSRFTHVTELLKYLTGAEDVLVVNNNAAALMLILRSFSKNKEVIVSRGELIEIGGSFRLPDVIAASDCIMKEVGTTNKTKITDYKNAISEETAVLLKAHRSNFQISGFTHEVSLNELVALGKKAGIPVVYDMGSGLLVKEGIDILREEPEAKKTLSTGIDLICFSGDKLLGGPQAGIIAGKSDMIARLKKEPMTRALRVDKLTLAFLEATCLQYLNMETLCKKNTVFCSLVRTPEEIKQKAKLMQQALEKYDVPGIITESRGQVGGGTMPDKEIKSYSVMIRSSYRSNKEKSRFSEKMHMALLQHEKPVLGVLKQGDIYFDVLTLSEEEIEKTARIINEVYHKLKKVQ